MSFILSGPRRTYVLVLFCASASNACRGCPASLMRARAAADATDTDPTPRGRCGTLCRVVLTIGLRRFIAGAVIGLRFYVVEAAA